MSTFAGSRRNEASKPLRTVLACAALACLCACGGSAPETAASQNAYRQAAAAPQATSVVRVATRDKFAYASHLEQSDGCETRHLEVFAFDASVRSDGTSTEQLEVRAQMVAGNSCTGVYAFLSGASVPGSPPSIEIRNSLRRAVVTATVELDDFMGTTKVLAIDLAWEGGELTTDKYRVVNVTPMSRTIITSVADLRHTEAISGALVLDGNDLLAADRQVLNRSTTGFVVGSQGATIEITRTPGQDRQP